MAKLYFRYGTVNSSKTAQLLMVRHNYISQTKNPITIAPSVDTRADGYIKSRALEETVKPDIVLGNFLIIDDFKLLEKADCVLVDECQFLDPSTITQLWAFSKEKNIPVICYGLRNDFRGELFPATKVLFSLADTIEEIKTECFFCRKKATFNLQLDETNKPIFSGDSVSIGYHYKPVCGSCYITLKELYS